MSDPRVAVEKAYAQGVEDVARLAQAAAAAVCETDLHVTRSAFASAALLALAAEAQALVPPIDITTIQPGDRP
jgi:hypothetical protein